MNISLTKSSTNSLLIQGLRTSVEVGKDETQAVRLPARTPLIQLKCSSSSSGWNLSIWCGWSLPNDPHQLAHTVSFRACRITVCSGKHGHVLNPWGSNYPSLEVTTVPCLTSETTLAPQLHRASERNRSWTEPKGGTSAFAPSLIEGTGTGRCLKVYSLELEPSACLHAMTPIP